MEGHRSLLAEEGEVQLEEVGQLWERIQEEGGGQHGEGEQGQQEQQVGVERSPEWATGGEHRGQAQVLARMELEGRKDGTWNELQRKMTVVSKFRIISSPGDLGSTGVHLKGRREHRHILKKLPSYGQFCLFCPSNFVIE